MGCNSCKNKKKEKYQELVKEVEKYDLIVWGALVVVSLLSGYGLITLISKFI